MKVDNKGLLSYMENVGPSHLLAHGVAAFLSLYALISRFVFQIDARPRDVMLKDAIGCVLLLVATTVFSASWADAVEAFDVSPSSAVDVFIGVNYLQYYLFVFTMYLAFKSRENRATQAEYAKEERELLGEDAADLLSGDEDDTASDSEDEDGDSDFSGSEDDDDFDGSSQGSYESDDDDGSSYTE